MLEKFIFTLFLIPIIITNLVSTHPTQESLEIDKNFTNDHRRIFKKVTHLIFDLDNTLIDTEAYHELILEKFCQSHGKKLPKGFRDRILGSPVEYEMEALKTELNISGASDELIEEMNKITKETYLTTQVQLMPGVEKLLRHFHHLGIPMAVATSSFREEAKIKTTQEHLKEVFSYVHHIVTADDVTHGKPAPDIFILAASKFPSSPMQEDCLVFEDAPNGLRAAYSARMQCVFIPQVEIEEELEQKASIILKSLEDFKPELFGLPALSNIKESR